MRKFLESVGVVTSLLVFFFIEGSPKEKLGGCGCLVAVTAILALAVFGVVKLFS